MSNYYDKELQQVIDKLAPKGVKIKVHSMCGETKWLDLNPDCIDALRNFLDILEYDPNDGAKDVGMSNGIIDSWND